MRVIVIGGTKFIGPYVICDLQKMGHEIIVFNRGKTSCTFPFPVTYVHGDRSNLLSFRDKLLSFSPDVVIDMISYSAKDAEQLVSTFGDVVKRIVVISSCDVYSAYDRLYQVFTDELISMPLNEESELRKFFFPYRKILQAKPNDANYYYEKILVEKIILSYPNINSTILRLPMVYGPGDYSRIYPYLKRMDDGIPILIDENKSVWRFCRGYVEDIAHAIVLSALDISLGNKIYNVGEKTACSEREWIQRIGQLAGCNYKLIEISCDQLPSHLKEPLLDWQQDLIIDSKRIRQELNYQELYSLEDSMRFSIDWLRTHSPTQVEHSFDYPAENRVASKII